MRKVIFGLCERFHHSLSGCRRLLAAQVLGLFDFRTGAMAKDWLFFVYSQSFRIFEMVIFDRNDIVILDGAMGTMIQRFNLQEDDYTVRSGEEVPWNGRPMKGNNEILNLTRPDVISDIHREYIEAGADIIESNTFSANRISQAEYGCSDLAARMAYEGAAIARRAADQAMEESAANGQEKEILVAGSMGPTSKSLSLSPDVSDPAFRNYSFKQVKEAYHEQAEALVRAGADLLLLETCFDALNVKAALAAIQELNQELGQDEQGSENKIRASLPIPVIVSVSVGDKSGRTLTGQTLKAFYTSVRHYPLAAFGLNCSLGAADLHELMKDVASWCECRTICYPNAGLPNEMGGYDQSPEQMASEVFAMASEGLLDITGGCCGTTPDHIAAIAKAVGQAKPHTKKAASGNEVRTSGKDRDNCFNHLTVSGLEAVTIDKEKYNFTNVGERTNVAGSRKFARLIAEGNYDQALQIAARQIEDGASIIDINMDDAMLDSAREMEKFTRWISNDPAVAKAALMIDSSDWNTIISGLENAQGKCIVNSISLKEGEDTFLHKSRIIRQMGAAVVVMAFDEQGQATTYDRKTEICGRAYKLLTEQAGMEPQDIIFDCNILSIGTGIAEHERYGIDFIEAVRWIKANLPGALTSGGLSNLSFAFRGNNTVREAMHSAFLFHAIRAGLDMAIVNPSMLQIYDSIESELLKCVEDVIFNSDEGATERLIAKASQIMAQKESSQEKTDIQTVDTSQLTVDERIGEALLKGRTETLEKDILEALEKYGKAVDVIQGPLMNAMEKVGDLFGQGKMFLPQVVKSAKVMRDAVAVLEPYMKADESQQSQGGERPSVVIATVKGDVHDIGKNITGIVLTCNGFDVHDLGVMVDKEVILAEAEKWDADIIAASGLITPSLFQMEELCRLMKARGMSKPLFIGGATTSALHTAVKLAPLYDHVYYGPDASASAVMAKKYMMDPESFEKEQHIRQDEMRSLYKSRNDKQEEQKVTKAEPGFSQEDFLTCRMTDIPVCEISSDLVMEYFDWRMFYAIWGIKYGKSIPEATELVQLRRDAEEELQFRNFRISLGLHFMQAQCKDDVISLEDTDSEGNDIIRNIPMMRQESGEGMSLCDFVASKDSGMKSVFGAFAISVHPAASHQEGCCCPACSDRYEEMVGRTVRMTLAEAASAWLDKEILSGRLCEEGTEILQGMKVIKPAAGYASCPDHSLKKDLLEMIPSSEKLGISLTESFAMSPDASICGMVLIHKHAKYPEIRSISEKQYQSYIQKRGMTPEQAHSLLSHLLK